MTEKGEVLDVTLAYEGDAWIGTNGKTGVDERFYVVRNPGFVRLLAPADTINVKVRVLDVDMSFLGVAVWVPAAWFDTALTKLDTIAPGLHPAVLQALVHEAAYQAEQNAFGNANGYRKLEKQIRKMLDPKPSKGNVVPKPALLQASHPAPEKSAVVAFEPLVITEYEILPFDPKRDQELLAAANERFSRAIGREPLSVERLMAQAEEYLLFVRSGEDALGFLRLGKPEPELPRSLNRLGIRPAGITALSISDVCPVGEPLDQRIHFLLDRAIWEAAQEYPDLGRNPLVIVDTNGRGKLAGSLKRAGYKRAILDFFVRTETEPQGGLLLPETSFGKNRATGQKLGGRMMRR